MPLDAADLPTSDELRNYLRGVIDPELGSDIVELGMVRGVVIDATGAVRVTIALTTSGCPLRAQIQRDIRSRIGSAPGVTAVKIEWTEMNAAERARAMDRARFNVAQRPEDTSVGPTTRVVLVASGKGGVGKSSVTANLAIALANRGHKVAVVDADVWGFSIPRMLGISNDPTVIDSMLVPPEVSGTISANLKDVTIFEALDAVREMYGYDYRVEGTRIYIKPLTLQTRVFQINYLTGNRQGASALRVSSGSISMSTVSR